MEKLNVVFGTAGHIDHGKTTLLKGLTGIDADRLIQEKELGITIDIGFAPWITPEVNMGFVDVPGHEKYVRNMVVGVSGIDGVLLVVAADEGIMPQTIEHVDICSMLEIKNIVVAITKIDLVDRSTVNERIEEVSLFLSQYDFNVVDFVPVSGVTHEGFERLEKSLLKMAKLVKRDDRGIPRLYVDRVFKLKGIGVVVTGTTIDGKFKVGDELEILPLNKRCKVRNIQVYEKNVKEAFSGQRTALNISGVDYSSLKRGVCLTLPDIFEPFQILNVKIRCSINHKKGIKDGHKVHFYAGTFHSVGKIYFPDEMNVLGKGEAEIAQIRLEDRVFALPCDKFIIRQYSPEITIGGGKILEVNSRKLKKREIRERRNILFKLDKCILKDFIKQKLESGIYTLRDFVRSVGRNENEMESVLIELEKEGLVDRLKYQDRIFYVRKRFIEEIFNHVEELLKESGRGGIKREDLQKKLKIFDNVIFSIILNLLFERKIAFKRNNVIFHFNFYDEKEDVKDGGMNKYEEFVFKRGLEGISPKEFEKKFGREGGEIFQILISRGKIIAVNKDFFISSRVFDDLVDKIEKKFGRSGEFSVGDFKNLTGLTRKRAIPLLELLDRKGITLRFGNVRRIRL